MIKQKSASKNYQKTVLIQANKEEVFKSLTEEINLWWGHTDSGIEKVGDIFTVSWGEPWYQFQIIDYQQNTSVTWECIDANQIIKDLEGVQKEWVGTKLFWSIQEKGEGQVEVSLVHEGLVPQFICYEVCSTTWDYFISERLKGFLENEE